MDKNIKKAENKKLEDIEGKFDLGNAGSCNDCTGLIQHEPFNDYEMDSYCEIYNFGPPNLGDSE